MNNAEIERLRKIANAYFNGKLAPIVLTIIGFFTIPIGVGFILIPIGLIWYVIDKNGSNSKDEVDIDQLIHSEMDRIYNRAYEKLSVIDEQIGIVTPLCLYGPAEEVEHNNSNNLVKVLYAFFYFVNFIFSMFVTLYNRIKHNQDLTIKLKIGKDNKFRYSYNQFTVYFFDKNQLYIYYADVDIITGIIHSEGTYEYYYSDIVGVVMQQTKIKKHLPKKLFSLSTPYVYNIREKVKIYTSGCYHIASVHSDIDHTFIDKQFKSMRNLIREKKRGLGQTLINS